MGPARLVARLSSVPLLGLVWLRAPPVPAQDLVERDGSLGIGPPELPLDASATYWIPAEMDERSGGNLFHSFICFGIRAIGTATFTVGSR